MLLHSHMPPLYHTSGFVCYYGVMGSHSDKVDEEIIHLTITSKCAWSEVIVITLVFGCMAASKFLRSVQSTNEADTPNLETTRRKYLLVPNEEKKSAHTCMHTHKYTCTPACTPACTLVQTHTQDYTPPYRSFMVTMWSPLLRVWMISEVAANPDDATYAGGSVQYSTVYTIIILPYSAPSLAAKHVSRTVRDGLPPLMYS